LAHLRACIHRGAVEIGGSCVELEQGGNRIVIDIGLPLDVLEDVEVSLPDVAGLGGGDPSLLGIVISHPHPDHYGLLPRIDRSVPVFIGAAAERILNEATFFVPRATTVTVSGHLTDRHTIELGPFRVTPYLMDHSGFDSYALLVESGEQRLLYSGDIRAHGRKGSLFESFVEHPPEGVDTLLLEGTHVRASGSDAAEPISEQDVEDRCAPVFSDTTGLVLASYSAQNIDRLVSLFKAAKRAGRTFVMDLYTASVAAATGRPATIPQSVWPEVAVYVPNAQRIRVKETASFDRVEAVRRDRIFPEQLAAEPEQYVLTFRASMCGELARAGCLDGAVAIWSMWAGYLERTSSGFQAWLDRNGIPLHVIHSSGHATVEDLQRFAAAVNATAVVPIHTAAPSRFAEFFDRVELRADGIWWSV
jgi:ribonuclease J